MKTIEVEKITIPYDKELLLRWENRDANIVPTFMLDWNGPGVSNGYGFGECMATQYFRDLGYYVFTNEFDLLSNKSKYKRSNEMINTIIGLNQLVKFNEVTKDAFERGFRIENPDLFVFDLDTCFFAEVKKDKDRLREPQMRFFYFVKEHLDIESKLIYLCDQSKEVKFEKVNFEFEI